MYKTVMISLEEERRGTLVLGFLNTLPKLRKLEKLSEDRFCNVVISIPAEQNGCGYVSLHECAFKKIKETVHQFEGYGELVC